MNNSIDSIVERLNTKEYDISGSEKYSRFQICVPPHIAKYWNKYKIENPRGLSQAVVRESFSFFQRIYGEEIPADWKREPADMKKRFGQQILENVLPVMYTETLDGIQCFTFDYFAQLMSRDPLYVLEVPVSRTYWNYLINLGYFVRTPNNPNVISLSDEVVKAQGKLEGL